jgi:hypothetical protein
LNSQYSDAKNAVANSRIHLNLMTSGLINSVTHCLEVESRVEGTRTREQSPRPPADVQRTEFTKSTDPKLRLWESGVDEYAS